MPKIKQAAENKFYELFKQILDTQSREIELLLEIKETLANAKPAEKTAVSKGWSDL